MYSCNEVILCKGVSEKNDNQHEYCQYLEAAGYNCKLLQTLSFKFINLESLRERLLSPEVYSGLILTSPRSIEAINCATEGLTCDLWKKLPGYCVGPTTELLARNCLNLQNYCGAQCGNAGDLAKYILETVIETEKPLLYPCSAIARDTVQQILDNGGLKIDKLIVYETLPSENLKDDLSNILSRQSSQILVFFSPSIVEFITNTAAKNFLSLENIKPVAIGPVTAEALIKAGLTVCATAVKPEPVALLSAIKNIDNINIMKQT